MDCYKCINGLYDEDCLVEPETCQEGQVSNDFETCYGASSRAHALDTLPWFRR